MAGYYAVLAVLLFMKKFVVVPRIIRIVSLKNPRSITTSVYTSTDPESFFRGGPTLRMFFFFLLLFLVNEWIQMPLKSGHHRPAREAGEPMIAQHWMLAWYLCDFFVIRTSIAKKTYIFAIFQVGVRTPCPPLWIRTCYRRKLWSMIKLLSRATLIMIIPNY